MGPLELRAYRKAWRESSLFRRGTIDEAHASAGRFAGQDRDLFSVVSDLESDDELGDIPERAGYAPSAARIAAALLLARTFDQRPDVGRELVAGTAPVIVDVADLPMLDAVKRVWRTTLFGDTARMLDLARFLPQPRDRLDGAFVFVKEPPKGAAKDALERAAVEMFAYALPFVAFSPSGRTHLPLALNAASKSRVEFPALDAATVSRTIRAVTGRKTTAPIDAKILRRLTITELAAAIRFDRTPEECVLELSRHSSLKDANRPSRALGLSDIFGMKEARAWADAAIADLAAWRRGEITWDEVASAVALAGPPGIGKTLFAEAFARSALGKDSEFGIPLIACSYYSWQSEGEGHLGHFLRAMRRDFARARSEKPAVILIDELDSFVDRQRVNHSHSDYVRNCINALLEEIDGVRRREGVILIGCSNAIEACDPALLRAGRFERVVRIGLPDPAELEQIFRVRLGDDLLDSDISEIVELAAGMTGADVERIVKDGRRAARRESRILRFEDLRHALAGDESSPAELRWRIAIHEAGHATVDVLRFGADGVLANTTRTDHRLGMSMRTTGPAFAGTAREYRARIEILLAGRAAEELLLGEASHGAQNDIAQATELTCAMLGSLGLSGPSPLTYLGDARDAREFLRFTDVRAAAGIELGEAERTCRELLESNRSALLAVARRLFRVGRVGGAEIDRLLDAFRHEREIAGKERKLPVPPDGGGE